jgi:hypothetical protein
LCQPDASDFSAQMHTNGSWTDWNTRFIGDLC